MEVPRSKSDIRPRRGGGQGDDKQRYAETKHLQPPHTLQGLPSFSVQRRPFPVLK